MRLSVWGKSEQFGLMGKTVHISGFPSHATADSVKSFLELRTGLGTVYAIKVRPPKRGGSRVYAIVQFTGAAQAELIISLANQRLWYGSSYLKARAADVDIVPKPRTYVHTLENLTLCFGCQVSSEKFHVLWEGDVELVTFGVEMRKMNFHLIHNFVEYRFQLSYENIWQIQLHRLQHQSMKCLLIQLYGAPRIYKKVAPSSGQIFDDPLFNFFKEVPDDQCVRTADFTPSYSIGQSSSLCLKLPNGRQLPNFRRHFAYYEEFEDEFKLVDGGNGFSCSDDLVPVVDSHPNVLLPYEIIFKVNVLVQNGCIPGPSLDTGFYRLVDPSRIRVEYVENALEKLFHLKECCYEPSSFLTEQYKKYAKHPSNSPAIALDAGLVYVRRVQITPCKVYFCGPEVNVSNRVLRHFSRDLDNFLRVSFVDEEWDKMRSTDLLPRMASSIENGKTDIYRRILSVLKNGIAIGDKKFKFLAFSSSQLRENSLWMFASRPGLDAAVIREWMGDFQHIKNPAKYAARLGQSFGSSTETLSVARHEREIIPDIEVQHGEVKYVFSDGIGKISSDFAKRVASKCVLAFTPSAFQIRYGGYKGVVAVDPRSSVKLSLRKSMCKFESDNTKLDVLGYSKYQPCFLNRQLITLLSTLGVKDEVFEKKQSEALEQLDAILTDPLKAQEALELMSPGENTNILKEMLKCGYKPDVEPYLSMMLQTFRESKLLELRTKSRIFIPNGRAMMGCLDETGTLEYGQVFVQISNARHRHISDTSAFDMSGSEDHLVIVGNVTVAKNPCLHPGDVRVLNAVNVPLLYHMVDCVVFPQKGSRPHPNECSGSDLDGDIYFVCWDTELIPPRQIPPMDYTPAPPIQLDRDVTIEDVQEYFVNYMVNDSLGIIANAHTAFADKEPFKARSAPCIELAKLFSIAVDFPKTGVPAIIPSHLNVKEFPDFMEKPDRHSYESKNVIGKLFRAVKGIAPNISYIRSFTRDVAMRCYDSDMEAEGFEDYVEDAIYHKTIYDYKLGNLLDYYGIKSESEIFSGNIMRMSKSFTRRRDAEAINLAARSLRKEARTWFNTKESGLDSGSDDLFAKASAWYHVTYHHSYWGSYNDGMKRDHYLSFPWCVYHKLMQVKENNLRKRERASRLATLDRFSRVLNLDGR
ncbi:probable RNA-dependent RNA polymerase 1 isoform X1 [Cucurbita maxima]|uniref:RNA-dependent RNA polymerase n=2 Tax=Cucurbita maxima TaxID=3661 RepID=A0A6J1K2N6_CUCMA|nr:probable RNA-dependent RNA polymerase 1 isoform X1 [Cucurbita maxima]